MHTPRELLTAAALDAMPSQRLEQDVCDYPHQNKRLYINGAQEDLVDMGHINT